MNSECCLWYDGKRGRQFEIFESARHFRIESRRPIRIQIEHRSFAGPYIKDEQIRKKNLKVEIHAMTVYKMNAVQVAETTLILTLSLLFSSKYRMAVVCPAFAAR